MVFCAKCGKKLNEGARFCPRCGTPVGEQGGAGTSVSQSGGGSSGTFSWDQAGQMREQRISGERCRTKQAHGCAFVFLAPGAAANPVREGLKVRQISCKPGAYVTACVDGMAVYICNAESGI